MLHFSASRAVLRRIVLSVGVVGVLVTAWKVNQDHEHGRLELELELGAERAARDVKEVLDSRFQLLEHFRWEWSRDPLRTRARFQDLSLDLQSRFPGFQAINWIDANGVIRQVAPEAANAAALGLDVSNHPVAGVALQQARETGTLQVTLPIVLAQGGLGFAVYLPVREGPQLAGYLNGVFRAAGLIEGCLYDPANHGFAYSFSDEGRSLGDYGSRGKVGDGPVQVERTFTVANRLWKVAVRPTLQRVDASTTWADEALLAAGIGLTVLITLLEMIVLARAERLRASEEKYRRIVDTAQEGVWVIDEKGRTTFANRRMGEILGYAPREMMGMSFMDYVHDDFGDEARTNFSRRREGVAESHRAEFRHRDGHKVHTFLATNPLQDDSGRFQGALAMVSDITERKQLEEQLLQSQKMEAIGRLAGGVAHDFNNLLTGILGAVDLLKMDLRERPEAIELLGEIEQCSNRAASLTRQLLAFSRKQVLLPRVIDLGGILQETLVLLRRLISEDVALNVEFAPNVGHVLADPTQVQQALVNLAVNARDAMPNGGTLTISASDFVVRPDSSSPQVSPGDYVRIEVTDTGHGIPPEIIGKIFEPFFSTKGLGRGTGLGLAMVHGVVNQSGGSIFVDSKVGKGTRFTIYLPRVAGDNATPVEGTLAARIGPSRGETILLVEDDRSVREVTVRALELAGYRVIQASDPELALKIVDEEGSRISLLITDVVMPVMTGVELARRITARHPSVSVIYMSGYADEDRLPHDIVSGHDFLQKPFSPDALLARAREKLDEVEHQRSA